ncbi:MAG TPA: L-serine ammonia-lyase, iron-sulfur-dependent, subunit alpha [Syntrophomonadaceae bacterium]|nr:L-serine ammonia-lyase, iron-sulfur-dependent, subunit alpha [Syntrophomonadaceae bacterium]
MYQFRHGVELLQLCKVNHKDIAEITIQAEIDESEKSREEIWLQMERIFTVMLNSVKDGLASDIKSMSGLIGGNAYLLNKHLDSGGISGNVVLKATSYALAVSEVNAAMGKIVAAPTGGASGVVPGVIIAIKEEHLLNNELAIKSLFVAGAIGKIIADNATLSGAEGGCQAEIGSASAMAAAAAVYMGGGTPEACLEAAAMALKGLLGLVCDPVAGLVEVPCSKRNATGTANALICADMALAGIESFIPFDEIVDVMFKVGNLISPSLRETAEGGCAIAPTAINFSQNYRKN